MRSAAHYASQSDPSLNRHFRRRWEEPAANRVERQRQPAKPRDLAALLASWRDEWRAQRRRAA